MSAIDENQFKSKQKDLEIVIDKDGNAHLRLNKIKVKNYDTWSRETSTLPSKLSTRDELMVLKEKVNVTFYQIRTF